MAKAERTLPEQTHALRRAIDADQRQIEDSLDALQRELDLAMEPVREAAAKTRETGERAKKQLTRARARIERAKEFEWRAWVAQNPWKAVGASAALGFYFGAMLHK